MVFIKKRFSSLNVVPFLMARIFLWNGYRKVWPIIRHYMLILFYFDFVHFVVPKFGDVAPISSDSKIRIQQFFALPVVDRIFKLELVIFPGSPSSSDSSDGNFPENNI